MSSSPTKTATATSLAHNNGNNGENGATRSSPRKHKLSVDSTSSPLTDDINSNNKRIHSPKRIRLSDEADRLTKLEVCFLITIGVVLILNRVLKLDISFFK